VRQITADSAVKGVNGGIAAQRARVRVMLQTAAVFQEGKGELRSLKERPMQSRLSAKGATNWVPSAQFI
jgi:hypothetical protein